MILRELKYSLYLYSCLSTPIFKEFDKFGWTVLQVKSRRTFSYLTIQPTNCLKLNLYLGRQFKEALDEIYRSNSNACSVVQIDNSH
jgi:hypothetical protein